MSHTTSSIMAQIQSLIAPPKSLESSSSRRTQPSTSSSSFLNINNGHLASKFNKKGNHETCDFCGELGERLLCCNRCPAAFHMLCYNPPLEIEKLPNGEWLCLRCQMNDKKKIALNGLKKLQKEQQLLQSYRNIQQQHLQQLNIDVANQQQEQTSNPESSNSLAKDEENSLNNDAMSNEDDISQHSLKCQSYIDKDSGQQDNSKKDNESEIVDSYLNLQIMDEISQASTESDADTDVTNQTSPECSSILREGFDLMYRSHKALILSPKKFEIPEKYHPDCPFYDPRKEIIVANGHGSTQKSSKISAYNTVTDDDLLGSYSGTDSGTQQDCKNIDDVGLPAKDSLSGNSNGNSVVCFQCDKTCRTEPLLRCDFCSLAFHTTCLDPPLTVLPDYYTAWMCPAHSHHLLQKKYLDPSPSLSQRIDLWKKHSDTPVDYEKIKTDFLMKVYDPHVPGKFYKPVPDYPTIRVPTSIKEAYQRRPVGRRRKSSRDYSSWIPNEETCNFDKQNFDQQPEVVISREKKEILPGKDLDEEQTEFLKSMFFFAGSIAKCLTEKDRENEKKIKASNDSEQNIEKMEIDNDSSNKKTVEDQINILEKACLGIKDETDEEMELEESLICHENLEQDSQEDMSKEDEPEEEIPFTILEFHENPFDFLRISAEDPSDDENSIETLSCPETGSELEAFQKKYRELSEEREKIRNASGKKIDTGSIDILDQIDLNLVRLLAFQRLQQLNMDGETLVKYDASIKEKMKKALKEFVYDSPVHARATIFPVIAYPEQKRKYCCDSKSMRFRSFTFGTDQDCDLILTDYGKCNRISSKHATVYFDEVEQCYELLNYSEHGTVVDDVHYCCDFGDKPSHRRQKYEEFTSETITGIENILLEPNRNRKEKLSRSNRKFLRKEFVYEEDNYVVSKRAIHDVQEINAQISAIAEGGGTLPVEKSPLKKIQFPKMKQVTKTSADLLKEVTSNKRGRARSRDEKPEEEEDDDDDHEGQKRMRHDSKSETSDIEEDNKEQKESNIKIEEDFLIEEELLRKWKSLANPPMLKMSSMKDHKWIPCRCDNDYSTDNSQTFGWEGSAILKHGSLIKFGCLEFVFCINSFADK